ncbi:MAG: hypothetical protein ACRDZO_12985 [Egibacteraceae bacterium]
MGEAVISPAEQLLQRLGAVGGGGRPPAGEQVGHERLDVAALDALDLGGEVGAFEEGGELQGGLLVALGWWENTWPISRPEPAFPVGSLVSSVEVAGRL